LNAAYGANWNEVLRWFEISLVLPIEAVPRATQFSGAHLSGRDVSLVLFYFYLVWIACCWSIRKTRNDRVFKNKVVSYPLRLRLIKLKFCLGEFVETDGSKKKDFRLILIICGLILRHAWIWICKVFLVALGVFLCCVACIWIFLAHLMYFSIIKIKMTQTKQWRYLVWGKVK
jgi:hypothetical protein